MRLPPYCMQCNGEPWIETPEGKVRCSCKRGMWYRFHPEYHARKKYKVPPLPARVWAERPGLDLAEQLEASTEAVEHRRYSMYERKNGMAEKISFRTNEWNEVALRWPDGLNVEGQYGPQVKFTTTDDRTFYLPELAGAKIRALRLQAGELFAIRKAEVNGKNGTRPHIEWEVQRVDPPSGEQPNGTLVVQKETAAPSPKVTAVPASTTHIYTNNSSNGISNGQQAASPFEHSGSAALLRETTNMLIDVLASCKSYSLKYNGLFAAEDVRSLMLSAYINISKAGPR